MQAAVPSLPSPATPPVWSEPPAVRRRSTATLEAVPLLAFVDAPPAARPRPMTPAAAALPAYRIHRAKSLAYVRLAGRMVYLGRAGTPGSHERYRRAIAEWLATGRPPRRAADAAAMTVAQLAGVYLRWARGYYLGSDGRPSPGLGPVQAAARALLALYGSTPAAAFGPVALRAVRQHMVAAGLCRNVVNQRTACVKRIFRWGVAEELVPANVLQGLAAVDPLRGGRSGARETPPVRPVPDAHVEAVLPFLPPTLAAMVRLQRLTGMRSGELCILRTGDVDTNSDVWIFRPASHKTHYRGHQRSVYLGPQARAVLEPWLRPDVPDAFVFSPSRAVRERLARRRADRRGGPAPASVDAHDDGAGADRYGPRSYRRALRYAMDAAARAGTPAQRWHPHQLRHRHATAVRESKGLEAARVLLGHRSLAQTLEYAAADSAAAAALARELA
jgi:integrase